MQVGLAPAAASVEPALLEQERAFQLSARHMDAKTLELHYKIADGYYMYRARFKFAIEPASAAKLGKPTFSKGKMKLDPTFGRVEVYRDSVRILLPIASLDNGTGSGETKPLRLKVTSQGCADLGICYPPLQQLLTLHAGVSELVFPDGVANAGDFAGRLQSTPQIAPHSLAESLGKSK